MSYQYIINKELQLQNPIFTEFYLKQNRLSTTQQENPKNSHEEMETPVPTDFKCRSVHLLNFRILFWREIIGACLGSFAGCLSLTVASFQIWH